MTERQLKNIERDNNLIFRLKMLIHEYENMPKDSNYCIRLDAWETLQALVKSCKKQIKKTGTITMGVL